jgi:glycerol-3-phosphate dehydrogenase
MSNAGAYNRDQQWDRLESADEPWDIAVIGGGATGVGVAIDAASRGYRVALCEQHDFGKGTSSRSTKLIHGGVRYLKQGHIGLVRSALRERGLLRQNAAHLVHPLANIVPLYSRLSGPYYGLGMKVYDWLSGQLSLGPSQRLSVADTLARIPTLQSNDLHGGVLYWDAQFDDARLLVNMVQTAIDRGAVCVNYAPVRELVKEQGRVRGFVVEDAETGRSACVAARVVVNATGPFSDLVRRLDDPTAEAAIAASQGIHVIFDGRFLPGETAMMIPKTRDGRVIFAIPWHGYTMLGSTDTPVAEAPLEPRPQRTEIDFLLETIAPYLSPAPLAGDIRSTWAGIRPLFRSTKTANTAKLGRDHVIRVSNSGLVSILGGKWTSYRKMAEDGVNRAVEVGGLTPAACRTENLPIRGGSDVSSLEELARSELGWNETLARPLPYTVGQVIWAARHEMARTVEDVLARRLRLLFLDAEAALAAAPRVAALLAAELGQDHAWQTEQLRRFTLLAANYRPATSHMRGVLGAE